MEILNDFLIINKQVLKKTIKSIRVNWIIIFTGIAYTLISIFAFFIFGIFFQGILRILSGIAIAIFTASLISNYLYLLFKVINFNKLRLDDFKDGFKVFTRKVYTILFFAYIGSYFLNFVQGILGFNAIILNLLITLSVLVLLNPLPETIYLKSYDPMDSITYAVDFMKENWLNWLIPNLVLYIGIFIFTGRIITSIFTTHLMYYSSIFNIFNLGSYLIGQVIFSFTMIYRGHLFKLLSTSTRRKRMFMSKF